jgi:hypothetical protein
MLEQEEERDIQATIEISPSSKSAGRKRRTGGKGLVRTTRLTQAEAKASETRQLDLGRLIQREPSSE